MSYSKIDWLVPIAGVLYEIGPLNMYQVGDIEALLQDGALVPVQAPNETYVFLTADTVTEDPNA